MSECPRDSLTGSLGGAARQLAPRRAPERGTGGDQRPSGKYREREHDHARCRRRQRHPYAEDPRDEAEEPDGDTCAEEQSCETTHRPTLRMGQVDTSPYGRVARCVPPSSEFTLP